MGAINAVGTQLTSHSVDHEATWPRVTLSNFQQRAGNAKELSGALAVRIAHFVAPEEFEDWDEYVTGPESIWM